MSFQSISRYKSWEVVQQKAKCSLKPQLLLLFLGVTLPTHLHCRLAGACSFEQIALLWRALFLL